MSFDELAAKCFGYKDLQPGDMFFEKTNSLTRVITIEAVDLVDNRVTYNYYTESPYGYISVVETLNLDDLLKLLIDYEKLKT